MIQQQAIIDYRSRPKWLQGRIVATDETAGYADSIDGSQQYVTSEPILGGQHFYLRVKQGYKVAFLVFFDRKTHKRIRYTTNADSWYNISGTSLSANIRDTITGPSRKASNIRTWIPADAYARVSVCNADAALADGVTTGTVISPSDDFLDAFYLFDTVFTPRRNDYAKPDCYATAMLLARQVNAAYTQAAAATKNTDGWIGYGTDNSICMGIPYSAVNAQRRGTMDMFMPSMETYLSVWANRRSLLYTDCPKAGTSEYGISWAHNTTPVSAYGRHPFGMVCNSVPATLFGMPEMADEIMWSNTNYFSVVYADISDLQADNGASLRSLDVAYTTGNHVLVVTDIFNVNGETFIEVLESSVNCQLYIITPEQLYTRLNNQETEDSRDYSFVRPKAAFYAAVGHYNFLPTAGAPTAFRQRSHYVPNDDICTFGGDKVSLCSGDMLWLNVRQTNGTTGDTFDSIRLYRHDGSTYQLLRTIEMETPASGHRKTFTDGDVVWDIDISSLFADGTLTGLFRATAYNSLTEAESDPCHFEVLNLNISGAWRIQYSSSVLAKLVDGDQQPYAAHVPFVGVAKSDYTVVRNNYQSFAHYLVGQYEEGIYGVVLVDAGSTEAAYCLLYAKGEYGYAYRCVALNASTLANLWYASGATDESGNLIRPDGTLLGRSGWKTRVIPITSSHQGKTYRLVWNDNVQPETYAMRVVQYDSNGDVISGKNQIYRSISDAASKATRLFDVEIAANCATMKVSTPIDGNNLSVIQNIVELPFSLNPVGGTETIVEVGSIEF